jgi:aspartyl protease family protein
MQTGDRYSCGGAEKRRGFAELMLKHVFILAVAVASAIGTAKGVALLAPPAAAAVAALPAFGRASDAAAVAKAGDGHFWADARVNGRTVRFLVDTGATAVALTTDDARRLGLDLSKLDFKDGVATAAGPARAAPVELAYVSVAGARVERVPAVVLDKGLPASLLGMSYLGRLSSFEASRTALVLHP